MADNDNERFSDLLVRDLRDRIQENKDARKRKGSPTPTQNDATPSQEQKRSKSPPPNVVARAPSFIRKAHDDGNSNPPTPVKPKEKKEEAAKVRPKQPESGKNLFGDTSLAKLPALPQAKRMESFDWDPNVERIDFADIGDDPFGVLPNITREEADEILDNLDAKPKPSPVLDSFDFDNDLGLLKAVSQTDQQINEIIAALGDGLITQEEADRELDEEVSKLELAKDMASNAEQSIKLYREKPCAVAKKSSPHKLTDNINIKF